MAHSYTLRWLAEYLGCTWQGNPDVCVNGIGNLASASPEQLSFLSNKRYAAYLESTQAAIVLLEQGYDAPPGLNALFVDNPYYAYAQLSSLFDERNIQPAGVHPSAVVHETAQIDPSAAIGPNCVIEAHARIGKDTQLGAGVVIGTKSVIGETCLIYANVSIYHGITIGDRVIIHSNTTVGSDGFGYAPGPSGWKKIHQLGAVRIGDDVEIGACSAIDRGAIDDTVIESGVIIDNQVHIAHNVRIGRNTAIAGCVGIAGSTVIGAHCTVGGFVAINGHLEICDDVHFNGGSVVTKSVTKSGAYSSGTILQDVKAWRKNAVRVSQLDEWIERIKKLEKSSSAGQLASDE